MPTYPENAAILLRKPSAIAPILMSIAALSVVLIAVAAGRATPQPDEGTAAHIWQLLMVGQVPFVGWFAGHWLKRDPTAALLILGLQLCAFIAAFLPVWLLGL